MEGNWKVFFSDGSFVTENLMSYWDNVPNRPVKKVIFTLLSGRDLVFENFKKICIARVGMTIAGSSEGLLQGYCITEVLDDRFNNFMILTDEPKITSHAINDLQIPEKCFRKGDN